MSLLFPFCKARGMEMRWQCCPAEGIWFTLSQGVQLCPHCCERPRWMPGIGLSAYICCSGKQICSPCLSAALPFLTGFFPFLSFFLFWLCLGHVPSQGSNPRSSHRLISRFCRRFCSSMWPWSQQSQLLDSALSWGAAECSPFLARGISKNRVNINTVSAVPCLTQGGGGHRQDCFVMSPSSKCTSFT